MAKAKGSARKARPSNADRAVDKALLRVMERAPKGVSVKHIEWDWGIDADGERAIQIRLWVHRSPTQRKRSSVWGELVAVVFDCLVAAEVFDWPYVSFVEV